MTDIRTPRTPLHPAPNEEVTQLPSGPMTDDMDLNPDLYDEEDVAVGIGNGNGIVTEDNDDNGSLLQEQDQVETSDEAVNMEESDMEPVDLSNGASRVEVELLTPDFDVYMDRVKSNFEANNEPQLSASQQSNLVMYLDDSILKAHRKFIKSQVNEEMTYPIIDLIADFTSIIDVLWLSVNRRNKLLFQGEYLIKMLGDMLDFIENYRYLVDPHGNNTAESLTTAIQKCFIFLQALDARIAFLMDGYSMELGQPIQKLSRTQVVRLVPVATRLRMAVIAKMEPLRRQLETLDNQKAVSILIDIEVSKLFEGILDRS